MFVFHKNLQLVFCFYLKKSWEISWVVFSVLNVRFILFLRIFKFGVNLKLGFHYLASKKVSSFSFKILTSF